MRYWKGSYDEDLARDGNLRPVCDEETESLLAFGILVGVQVVSLILAVLLFVTSR